ncbi:hypothetical protein P280DRAFT_199485 [Massarina eburnea CBS 473.64]|uniref:Uncharacterized protein n=1 Tax=Massarina eburnea CBS 473.64 TaxID=1395130 RepID=A0A6A6RKY2_9PLEO|nr:hypothetical protein P280DRAFT_199485 [Massarina eburnea CBS 473.64]
MARWPTREPLAFLFEFSRLFLDGFLGLHYSSHHCHLTTVRLCIGRGLGRLFLLSSVYIWISFVNIFGFPRIPRDFGLGRIWRDHWVSFDVALSARRSNRIEHFFAVWLDYTPLNSQCLSSYFYRTLALILILILTLVSARECGLRMRSP